MKLSYSFLTSLLLGAAIAAPSKLEQRKLSNGPVNIQHNLEDGEVIECSRNGYYNDDEIRATISRAVNLQRARETRGSKLFPSDTSLYQPYPE